MSEILTLQPECIWRNFHLLTQVPRPSGHLEKVQQALLDFAAKAGVEAFIDPAGNVVMKKPATPGMENRLQQKKKRRKNRLQQGQKWLQQKKKRKLTIS